MKIFKFNKLSLIQMLQKVIFKFALKLLIFNGFRGKFMPDSIIMPKISFQKTINKEISFQGIGLHSGLNVNVKILPAKVNEGIRFIRTDLQEKEIIVAYYKNVNETKLGTTLINSKGIKVKTVEHLMAAFMGVGIDNATVILSACEVPIMDGSSEKFVNLFKAVGLKEQFVTKKYIRAIKTVKVKDGSSSIEIKPASNFIVDYKIDFIDTAIGIQRYKTTFKSKTFEKEIGSARTFGMLNDVENLHRNGLALGGSIDNAIVIDNGKILNPDGLRYNNEFVRHKILDLCGDMYLAGMNIKGHIKAIRSGHKLNNKFLWEFLSDTENYEIIESSSLHMEKEVTLVLA